MRIDDHLIYESLTDNRKFIIIVADDIKDDRRKIIQEHDYVSYNYIKDNKITPIWCVMGDLDFIVYMMRKFGCIRPTSDPSTYRTTRFSDDSWANFKYWRNGPGDYRKEDYSKYKAKLAALDPDEMDISNL